MSKLSSEDVRPHLVADALRRHILLILGCTVVVAVALVAVAQGRATTYTSTANVLVRPTLGNPFAPDTGSSGQQVTIAMETESQVAQSAPVAAIANKTLKTPFVPGSGTVVATVPPNTQVVSVSFTAPSAAAAKAGAQTVAQSFLDYRTSQTSDTQKSRMDTLTKQADAVRKSLDTASAQAAKTDAPPQAAQQVQLYANQLVTIQNSISTLESGGANPGSIISPATLPTNPSGISPLLLGLGGALFGFALGLLIAIWLERRDKAVRSGTDTSVGPVPVLAYDAGERAGLWARLGGRAGGTGGDAAGTRALAQRLRSAVLAKSPAPAAVVVAGVTEDVSAAEVAVDLGLALSEAGHEVVVIDTDPRRGVERVLGVEAKEGLSDVLLGSEVTKHLMQTQGLRVLPAGQDLLDNEALLFSDRFSNVLSDMRAKVDYVIVSSAPAIGPTGVGMSVATDTTVLVAADGVTSAVDIEGVAARADRLGIRLLGLVVTPRPKRAKSKDRDQDRGSSPHIGGRPEPTSDAESATEVSVSSSDLPMAHTETGVHGAPLVAANDESRLST